MGLAVFVFRSSPHDSPSPPASRCLCYDASSVACFGATLFSPPEQSGSTCLPMTRPPGIERGLRLNAPSAADAAGEPLGSSGWNQKRLPLWPKPSGWGTISTSSSGVLFGAWEPEKAWSNIPTAIASFSIRKPVDAPSIRLAPSSAELGLSGPPIWRIPKPGNKPLANVQAATRAPSTA